MHHCLTYHEALQVPASLKCHISLHQWLQEAGLLAALRHPNVGLCPSLGCHCLPPLLATASAACCSWSQLKSWCTSGSCVDRSNSRCLPCPTPAENAAGRWLSGGGAGASVHCVRVLPARSVTCKQHKSTSSEHRLHGRLVGPPSPWLVSGGLAAQIATSFSCTIVLRPALYPARFLGSLFDMLSEARTSPELAKRLDWARRLRMVSRMLAPAIAGAPSSRQGRQSIAAAAKCCCCYCRCC